MVSPAPTDQPALADRTSLPLYTIAPHLPFADHLATGILTLTEGDPLALSQVTLLLPSRRACRAQQEAFLRALDGKPCLLPRMIPLGEVEEDRLVLSSVEAHTNLPPAMAPAEREFLLARLILSFRQDHHLTTDQALRLARDLAGLLDEVYIEAVSLEGLADIVPSRFAEHWQETVKFLAILTEHWPRILQERNQLDAMDRRVRLLRAQAAQWRATPPTNLVICAGSTGTWPAVADLMGCILTLPRGMVILPGLDQTSGDDLWHTIEQTQTHPQYPLARFLRHHEIDRATVQAWPHGAENASSNLAPASRGDLVAAAMLPAGDLSEWQAIAADGKRRPALRDAAQDIARIACRDDASEAALIAVLLRETLEQPGKTAALVTPDRQLARRVQAELQRWNIDIDDSAGLELAQTPPAVLMRLIIDVINENFAPVPLLALLKHPLVRLDQDPGSLRESVRHLERKILRGPRPPSGLAGLALAMLEADYPPPAWWETFTQALAPLATLLVQEPQPLGSLLKSHIQAAEGLAGAEILWQGDAGEKLAAKIGEWRESHVHLPPLPMARYGALFDTLLSGIKVAPAYRKHPRLSIVGTLEARLQHWDRVILGGLNEGTWPAIAETDPWLHRPLRSDLNLPLPERFIGLAAHDITQALCRPEVFLTRAERSGGTTTVPSRWWLRLEGLLAVLGLSDADHDRARHLKTWADRLRRSSALKIIPLPAPTPAPPAAIRPHIFSVSDIELLRANPYGYYVKQILKLKRLPDLDEEAAAASYGELVHDCLAGTIAPDGVMSLVGLHQAILARAEIFFDRHRHDPALRALWQPLIAEIARWFARTEHARQPLVTRRYAEIEGQAPLDGRFIIKARADRIDVMRDGSAVIIDYKTGTVPTASEVKRGLKPQLPLEAYILAAGGFAQIDARPQDIAMEYWRLTGLVREAGKIIVPFARKDDKPTVLQNVIDITLQELTRYSQGDQAYEVGVALRYDDYAHLARRAEWQSVEPESEGE